MPTTLQVLTREDCDQIHQRSLELLGTTGVRVDSERGRDLLHAAGAKPGGAQNVVRFPPDLVTACLASAPRRFTLGGRRPGWSFPMNAGQFALLADGGAIFSLDADSRTRRPATLADWQQATRITDALDEFACYWGVVDGVFGTRPPDLVTHWVEIFRNFSKHVQEASAAPEETRWLREILHILFGTQEDIRRLRPLSFLICPSSPLVIEAGYTDAYLETLGLELPAAIMPMPLLGTTGPGTLISNLLLANCEVLAMLCLIQVAQPGTPVIYAPIPAISNPYSGRFGSGEVEHSLLDAAVTEIARYYQLPVEASAGGSDHHVPGIQAGYERALNFVLPVLSQPDLLVAPGLLGGSMIFSPEQFILDLEIVRRCRRLARGIGNAPAEWLEEVIARVGPGGNFLTHRSTRAALRAGQVYISTLGCHEPYERWEAEGRPDILQEARQEFERLVETHKPIPFSNEVERELGRLQKFALEEA